MSSLKMYCLSLDPKHLGIIKKINYIPVGLGEENFTNEWLSDRTENHISLKNKFYGEYTFHYWIWKNYQDKIGDDWVGFCQYRKFWSLKKSGIQNVSFEHFNENILKEIPKEFLKYETILGEPLFINQFRFSKFIKNNLKTMINEPSLFLNKKKRTIKFHFDMMHGLGNLDKAIELLELEERNDFTEFVNTNVSFNPQNMLICKSKSFLTSYYNSIFPWLTRCEKIFGFEDLKGYGLQRIYAFLAERYMSYWFQKYTKFKIMPIFFKDISDYLD